MADNGKQAATQPAGFWKIRHAGMGLGALLLVIVVVRSCGGDAEDERFEAESGNAVPRQAIAVKIPAPQWQGQYPPAQQQQPAYGYPAQQQQPAYGTPAQQQQPAYGYPAQQQQPAYGYPAQQQQPAYGTPAQQQQQPAYGYPAQQLQQQRQLPATDPGNPWAVQQPAYSYGAQQTQQWGQTRRQPPVYSQSPGSGQYRPLDEKPHTAQQRRRSAAPTAATGWPSAAPYDRLSGSSFGGAGGTYPYTGSYPGYYGGTSYGAPAYGGGWPGGGLGYPGAGWPGYR
jgi:hypothetical protein